MNAFGNRLYSCRRSKKDYNEEKVIKVGDGGYQLLLVVGGGIVDYECNQKAWQIRRHGNG